METAFVPPPTAVSGEDSHPPRPVEMRIQLGDYFGFPFRERVLSSNSNSTAAIYFVRDHVETIADGLGVTYDADTTKAQLYDRIRDAVGRGWAGGRPFYREDLLAILDVLGIEPKTDPELVTKIYDQKGCPVAGEALYTLLQASYVDICFSGDESARMWWPSRMHPPRRARQPYREACDTYIIDSDYDDPTVTVQDVLETATELQADCVVLADVEQDVDATVDATIRGLETVADHAFDGDVIVPLQPPHGACLQRLLDRGIGTDHIFGIGGYRNKADSKKIRAAREVREILGPDVHLHGFGYGITPELASAIRDNPALLDSVDYSTPATDFDTDVANGAERISITASQAGAELIRDIRSVTPFPDHQQQSQLSSFAATASA